VDSPVLEPSSTSDQASVGAMRWSAVDALARQGVTFAVMVILARLLSPEEFGLVGMLSIFIAIAASIVDSGFGSALIQRKKITETDKSSVFYFNMAVGAVGAWMLFLAAPAIAQFYRQPVLSPMMRWMGVNLFIESLGVVQVALLTKNMDFRSQFKAAFLALLVSGTVAVFMAARGWGVWSLVAQTLVSTTVFTVTIWVVCSWRPQTRFQGSSLRSLARFGSPLLVSGLLNVAFERAHPAIIGKSFSAAQLGYYNRAYSTQQSPSTLLSAMVGRVMFPIFSQVSDDTRTFRRKVRNALVTLMFVTLPVMAGLAVVAEPLVMVAFGRKWLPCVPYLRLLAIAGLCWPIHVVNLNITMAVGRTDLFLRLEVVKKVLIAIGILCTFRISVLAMIWATVAVSFTAMVVNSHFSEFLVQYGLRKQLRDLFPYLAISAVVACVGLLVLHLIHIAPLGELIIAIFACGALYVALCHVLRLEGWTTVKDLLTRTRTWGTTESLVSLPQSFIE
jgi:teichuronic acid exporter